MSRKRNPKFTLVNKQKELITSRLMQISLKVDDYVYKDVPITAKNAAMFIKEVSGYKSECYGDTRSLQVIEKLIRCMKGIIEEQPELESYSAERDVTLVDIEAILASPIHEDTNITQCIQKTQVNKDLETPKNNIESVNLDNETDTDIDEHINRNEINLCNNIDENKNKRDGSSNRHLERAISDLNIGDNDGPLSIAAFNLADCSPSILDNVESFNETSKTLIANKILHSQDFEEIIQPATIAKKYNNEAAKNVDPTSTKKNRMRKVPKTSNKVNNSFNPLKLTTASTKNTCEIDKNITKAKEKVKRKRNQNPTEKPNKTNKQQTIQTFGKINKQKRKELELNAVANKVLEKNKNSEKSYKNDALKSIKSQITTVHNRGLNHNCNQRASDEILSHYKNRFSKSSPINAIYNTNTENDLSWIENIRFVREIDPAEKIPAHYKDGFWQNFILPSDWNDDDFLYT